VLHSYCVLSPAEQDLIKFVKQRILPSKPMTQAVLVMSDKPRKTKRNGYKNWKKIFMRRRKRMTMLRSVQWCYQVFALCKY
jgi:hypothetical protein